ncbi:2-succinyl-5-enolpyruvyl-6-hydroxy-3-cyclohexene-1-carboxylic-acid synthase [Bizionia sp. KMM 8389]
MQYPKIPLAQTIVQLCKAKNIQHIVISPGSRSAPVTLGFTHDDYFTCYSVVDERCAAFFALGIAQQIQYPVAILCSSGSALLNYYPAIAEAYFSHIPLVVLSADRPEHLIGIGDGQTINQPHVYQNHILYEANLQSAINQELESTEIQEENESEINLALNKAISKSGPVHINMPFHEPLYELTNELLVNPKVFESEQEPNNVADSVYEACIDLWNSSTRKMILVGVNHPNTVDEKWLEILVKDPSVIVLTETTSNIHNPEFFNSIDTLIAPLETDDFEGLQPEILITFGGLIVSKKIKAFLRTFKPKSHWHIDEDYANDTFFCLDKHITTTPNTFFKTFLPQVSNTIISNYKDTWQEVKAYRKDKQFKYLNKIAYSDFQVFETLIKSLPLQTVLQLGNSSTIRYAQLFEIPKSIQVFCNRGTSGIDGSTSTAIGAAVTQNKQTIFITGDLSFFYDSNALWNNYIPNNFRLVIINNQGGGIFRILPGNKDSDNFENFFETKHQLTAEHLAAMYGFQYHKTTNLQELNDNLETFYAPSEQPKILEIFTPRAENDKVLLNYFSYIK